MGALTKREDGIAYEIAKGFSEKEIATRLFIAESTVHTHTKNIRKKIDARSAVDVARYYILQNPQKFFLAVMFLVMQSFMIFSAEDFQYRRVRVSAKVKTSKTKTKEYV